MATVLPQLTAWSDFYPWFAGEWKQGDHVTVVGPTGCGKTTLVREILPIRTWNVVVATKPKDPLLKTFKGYRVTHDWPVEDYYRHVLYWHPSKPSELSKQREAIKRLLEDVYERGGWTIYLDEARYITDFLKLGSLCELMWMQLRSSNATLIASAQRARHIPLLAYNQATHLFLGRENDAGNIERMAEFDGANKRELTAILGNLDRHDLLYVNTRTGDRCVTRVDLGR